MTSGKSWGLCGVMLLASLSVSCGSEVAPRNLVLISIDSLRADRLSSYGAERATSPALDSLAAEGALFESAIATSPWTLPSHVSLLTGLSTSAHRVNHPDSRIDPARTLLAEQLRAHGYQTVAFVSAPYLHRAYGFDRGFDVYENLQGEGALRFPPNAEGHEDSHADQTAKEVIDRSLTWLRDQPVGAEPWFAFVHLWDVHYDYLAPQSVVDLFDPDYAGDVDGRDFLSNPAVAPGMPARDLEHLRALYDAEVRAVDMQIARLLEALRAREPREQIVIAVVSDHGDEFFEHGKKGHTQNLFEESMRVPWLLRAPGLVQAGTRIPDVASLADVAPTLLGLLGAPPLEEATGRNLSPLLAGGAMSSEAVLLVFPPYAALRGSDWKLIVSGRKGEPAYYDLNADPAEQRPQRASLAAPQKLAELSRRLEAAARHADSLVWQGGQGVELDEATRERLKELGYAQ